MSGRPRSRWRLLLRGLVSRQELLGGKGGPNSMSRRARLGGVCHECPPSADEEAYLHWVRETGAWRLHGTLVPPYQPQR